MVTNPKYKLNFLGMSKIPSHIWRNIRSTLINAGLEILWKDINQTEIEATTQVTTQANANVFAREDAAGAYNLLIENDVPVEIVNSIDVQMEIEVETYLHAKATTDIVEGLKNFPTIQRLYMKYNSIRSTEAICERMFSYAGKSNERTNELYFICMYCHVNMSFV